MIIFSKRNIIGSHLIRWFSPSKNKHSFKASHVSLLSTYNMIMIESVVGDGVRLNYLYTFCKQNKIVAAYDYLGEDQADKFVQILKENHGKKYDYLGVLWFIVYFIMRFFGRELKRNSLDKKNKLFCNEILYPVLPLTLNTMTPEDLRDYLDNSDFGKQNFKRFV